MRDKGRREKETGEPEERQIETETGMRKKDIVCVIEKERLGRVMA